jgi:conjugative relaxase-like TrwC/TraI family protein
VLSVAKLTLGQELYYEQQVARGLDDYYAGRGESPGLWAGSGSAGLGLAGVVEDGDLGTLLRGLNPRDRETLRSPVRERTITARRLDLETGEWREEEKRLAPVSGFDLVFSCPKSVSLLHALTEDEQARREVSEAHEASWQAALAYLEREACIVRRGKGGAIREHGSGFVAAAFRHRTSRAQEPHLHTHVIVANMTRSEDGEWRALDGEAILKTYRLAAGYLYEAELRGELTRRLGLEWTEPVKGMAEPKNVPEEALACLLQSQAVAPGAHGSPRDGGLRRLPRRRARDQRAKGGGRAAAAQGGVARQGGRARPRISRALRARPLRTDQAPACRPRAARVLAARPRGADGEGDLLRSARARAGGGRRAAARGERLRGRGDRRIPHAPAGCRAARARRFGPAGQVHESRAARARARGSPDRHRGPGRGRSLPGQADAPAAPPARALPEPGAARTRPRSLRATGSGRLRGWGPGSGKTSALRVLADACRECDIAVLGAAPSGRAADELTTGAGIQSRTLHRLLLDAEREGGLPRRSLVVVDEAGMAETRVLAPLLRLAEEAEAKVLLVGDPAQLPSVGAGGLYQALCERLGAIELTVNQRQRDLSEREALERLREGEPEPYLARQARRGRLSVEENPLAAKRQLLADWWRYAQHDPERTYMLAYHRQDVHELSEAAHALMLRSGRLGEEAVELGGREFRVGERVLCKRNDVSLRIRNGSRGTIVAIDREALILREDAGPARRLPFTYAEEHLDHGYALTGHAAQGTTLERAFVPLPDHGSLKEWGYVATSRAREETHLYLTHQALEPGDSHTREINERTAPERAARALERPAAEPLALEQRRGRGDTILNHLAQQRQQLDRQRQRTAGQLAGARRELQHLRWWNRDRRAERTGDRPRSGRAQAPREAAGAAAPAGHRAHSDDRARPRTRRA